MRRKPEDRPFKITNHMADGTIRDDLSGYTIPYNEKTKGIYETFAAIIRAHEANK